MNDTSRLFGWFAALWTRRILAAVAVTGCVTVCLASAGAAAAVKPSSARAPEATRGSTPQPAGIHRFSSSALHRLGRTAPDPLSRLADR